MRKIFTLTLLMLIASSTYAQALNGTLEKVKEAKRIVIGFQEASIPFSYLDGNQKPVGFTIDICSKIVDDIRKDVKDPDLEIKYVPVTPANRIPLLLNGTIDLECASATNNVERQRQISFTNTHFLTANRVLSKKTSNIKSLKDLKEKNVVSIAGSTNINQLYKFNSDNNFRMNIISAKDQLEAFLMLETNRADAYVMDDVQLAIAAARSKDPSLYVISKESLSKPEPYAIMLRKNDPAFKAVVDKATAALYRSQEIEALYKKWFQSPVPPNGINFQYPLDRELQSAFKNPSDSADPDHYKIKN